MLNADIRRQRTQPTRGAGAADVDGGPCRSASDRLAHGPLESWRLDEFSAWRPFLLTRAGKPDLEQNLTLNGGEMRPAAEWRYYCESTVTVTLAASIPTDLNGA